MSWIGAATTESKMSTMVTMNAWRKVDTCLPWVPEHSDCAQVCYSLHGLRARRTTEHESGAGKAQSLTI